jgi:hypothetical protein
VSIAETRYEHIILNQDKVPIIAGTKMCQNRFVVISSFDAITAFKLFGFLPYLFIDVILD